MFCGFYKKIREIKLNSLRKKICICFNNISKNEYMLRISQSYMLLRFSIQRHRLEKKRFYRILGFRTCIKSFTRHKKVKKKIKILEIVCVMRNEIIYHVILTTCTSKLPSLP